MIVNQVDSIVNHVDSIYIQYYKTNKMTELGKYTLFRKQIDSIYKDSIQKFSLPQK